VRLTISVVNCNLEPDMATQVVMDHSGDSRHFFDSADPEAIRRAETLFNDLTAKGYTARRGREPARSQDWESLIRPRKKRCSSRAWLAVDRAEIGQPTPSPPIRVAGPCNYQTVSRILRGKDEPWALVAAAPQLAFGRAKSPARSKRIFRGSRKRQPQKIPNPSGNVSQCPRDR